ncbi:MAG: pyroglutamyl-peptidase I [Oscillospiraceae bacterium]|nr:pyroglutamyl-peptidase I [Oscillospiraceae bacterium]
MTILVTAFDPFGGESVNPAQLAVEALPDIIGGHTIIKAIIPTVFGQSADQVTALMDAHSPDAVVCIGQAGGRDAITPERVAINIMDAKRPDNAGMIPEDVPIVPDGPAAYFSTLPVKAMVSAITAAGIPARLSNTAGTFVCNQLLYRCLHHAATRMPDCRCGFIHVPYIPEQTSEKPDMFAMALEDIVKGLTAAMAAIE